MLSKRRVFRARRPGVTAAIPPAARSRPIWTAPLSAGALATVDFGITCVHGPMLVQASAGDGRRRGLLLGNGGGVP